MTFLTGRLYPWGTTTGQGQFIDPCTVSVARLLLGPLIHFLYDLPWVFSKFPFENFILDMLQRNKGDNFILCMVKVNSDTGDN